MPLFQTGNLTDGGSWALWQLEEPEQQLQQQLNPNCFPLQELQNIRVEQRRLEWLGCRLALQTLLPDVGASCLQKTSFGRPFLQPEGLHISLSHAYPFAAAAVHPARPVGLDIEKPRPQLLRIKHKFLSLQEQALVGDNLEQLCLWWAVKEALYKLNGQPGLIFARDMEVAPQAGTNRLQALLYGRPYELHYQWFKDLLLCVVT
jgi:4'-phosphopantetheinyl transferase